MSDPRRTQIERLQEMGTALKTKDRAGIERQPMPEQAPEVRRHNTEEVPLGYDATAAQLEAFRCMGCKLKFCVAGCPVGVDIPAFIGAIREGDFQRAIDTIRAANCLPAVTGRVCPQETQCQATCQMGRIKKNVEESVSIGRLERFVADWEREHDTFALPSLPPPSGKRVAVVGSGPAGLAVAGDLAKLGHEVHVFEAFHKAGGVLIYGIPEFRLPKKIVAVEIAMLEKLGVRFAMNQVVGQTVTVDELLGEEGFKAVFVGTGAGLPTFMRIPGEELIGVYSANEYLTRANLMQAYRFPETDTPTIRAAAVAVFGGGNVAMDSARTALRLGAQKVYLIYRRSESEMPARAEEAHHAKQEGVEFLLLTNPVEILADAAGCVSGLRLQKMELGEPDASGRRRPLPVAGSEYELPVDCVIEAIGNGPNPLIPATTPGLATTKWGNIIADKDSCKTSKPGVFAGGDIVLGAATVILAMGEGRRAATAIHDYLTNGVW